MARQTDGFELQGSLGGLCFYKTKYGYFVRTKSSISKSRIKSHPTYEVTRQNNAEFKRAAQGVKLFRSAFRALLHRIGEKGATGQLMRTMFEVIRADEINEHGQRTVTDGAPQLLEGFEFNEHAKLREILSARLTPSIDRKASSMTVDIEGSSVATMVSAPEGTTHIRFFSGAAVIDFERHALKVATSETACLPITSKKIGKIHLSQKVGSGSPGHAFLLLGIEFLNVSKGTETPVASGRHNALAIIKAG